MDALRDTQDIGEIIQYIIIKLADEQYGIDIKYIDNIVRMQNITRVPKVDDYFKGVLNIRGVIVPVMSIRVLMGMEEDVITNKSRIIILKIGDEGELLGIIVDQVNQVLNIGAANIDKLSFDEKTKKSNGKFISGVGKYEGGLVSILDLTALDPETAKEKKE
ncbi:MAG: chemotaxis protein CheW [Butyrivibrio sp.]|uniref:chemotaxis protein CheW n=1 Tax=Butyrivibrio sp. TaxID=28121 RepID=UPI0025E2BD3A|nr:chemotaxis protein CheW [Butyrivibrio sp.]MCR5772276.1 chemotaxis protein CheW [Butyrivibrio sp.]